MLFNSFQFLIFFPLVLMIYYLFKNKNFRIVWLLVCSYYFYMCWNPKYALLIFFSTIVTYLSGILISTSKKKQFKLIYMILSLIINLAILVLFKYYSFLIENINAILNFLSIEQINNNFDILLPVGISFYTFQALSYSIDVYRKDVEVEKNFLKYALFVSFFPQLVAGPIEKSKNLLPQFDLEHRFQYNEVKKGIIIILFGYIQKVVIADRISIVVNQVYNNVNNYSGVYLIIATVLFAFQIYCDFNSYSLIAKGCAKILGYKLTDNFNRPYLSQNVRMFWNNWHISLSSWFKEYLYFPLGGSRVSLIKHLRNIIIVFLVSGLWHGAAWTFIIWGALHALYQIFEILYRRVKITNSNNIFKILFTFVLVDFAWIFFRANSLEDAIYIIKNLFVFNSNFNVQLLNIDIYNFAIIIISIIFLYLYEIISLKFNFYKWFNNTNIALRWWIYYLFIFSILILGIYGPQYDASQFIYFQF